MELTEEQYEKREKLISFLKEHDIVDYDQYKQLILDKNDDPLEYYICDDDKCLNVSIKNIRKELPKYTRLFVERHCNDGDHDSFECCSVCGKHLNKYLTWYEDELDYLIQNCKTKDDVMEAENVFKIVGLVESTGWLADSINSEKAKEKLINFIEKTLSILQS